MQCFDRRRNICTPGNTSRCTKGSVMSPTLYSLYINGIPQTTGIYVALFAGDICISYVRQIARRVTFSEIYNADSLWNINISEAKTQAIFSLIDVDQ